MDEERRPTSFRDLLVALVNGNVAFIVVGGVRARGRSDSSYAAFGSSHAGGTKARFLLTV